jgi:hypothetical protein
MPASAGTGGSGTVADPDAFTLSDRNDLFDEVGVVAPALLGHELTTVREWLVEPGV